jgi:hypothetical protein
MDALLMLRRYHARLTGAPEPDDAGDDDAG